MLSFFASRNRMQTREGKGRQRKATWNNNNDNNNKQGHRWNGWVVKKLRGLGGLTWRLQSVHCREVVWIKKKG